MSRDAERAWQEARDRARAAHVERVMVTADELARRYVVLLGMVGGGAASDEVAGKRPPGPRVPVSLDVVDLLFDIEAAAVRYLPRLRGALRMGLGTGQTRSRAETVGRFCHLVAGELAGVYGDDEGLGDDVSRKVGRLNMRAGLVTGEKARPFRLDSACSECSRAMRLVIPDRLVVRCAGCGKEDAVQFSQLVMSL